MMRVLKFDEKITSLDIGVGYESFHQLSKKIKLNDWAKTFVGMKK